MSAVWAAISSTDGNIRFYLKRPAIVVITGRIAHTHT
jgi:hypothetical protein